MIRIKKINFGFILIGIFLLDVFLFIKVVGFGELKCKLSFWKQICIRRNVDDVRIQLNKKLLEEKKQVTGNFSWDSIEGGYNLSGRFVDEFGKPLEKLYVTVYNSDLWPVYEFSILQIGDDGKVDFFITEGEYKLVVSSRRQYYSEDKPAVFFVMPIKVDSDSNNSTVSIDLYKTKILFDDFEGRLPDMKIEAVAVIAGKMTWSQLFSGFDSNSASAEFYISPGEYNINLDVLDFKSRDTISYALAVRGLMPGKENEVVFNPSQFKMFTVELADVNFGWIKLNTKDTGDFQSSYFGNPVKIYTNLPDLESEMFYIPSGECVDYWIKKLSDDGVEDSEMKALNNCTSTDIRFDLSKNVNYQESNIYYAPDSIKIFELSGDKNVYENNLRFGYVVVDRDGNRFSDINIHSLWETSIYPRFYITNSSGVKVLDESMSGFVRPDLSKNMFLATIPICIPKGKYTVNLELPSFNWGNKNMMDSYNFIVEKGCGDDIKTRINENKNVNDWSQIYLERKAYFQVNKDSYVTTLRHDKNNLINADIPFVDKIVFETLCEDLEKIGQGLYLLKINEKSLESNNISTCTERFIQKNLEKMAVILKGEYSEYSVFQTNTKYVNYYFYKVLKKLGGSNLSVGIYVDDFFQLFYGYFDFYYVDKETEIFPNWLAPYSGLINNNKVYFVGSKTQ